MKADELQIGDWVQNPLGLVGRVKSIKYMPKEFVDEYGGYYYVTFVFGESYQSLDIKGAHPIPLTPEILEKNGFKIIHGFGYSESYPTYGWGYHKGLRDYASVDVTFYDEPIGGVSRLVKMETASKKDDGINSIHSCDIEFIHDLQHALRLCGIEKEITL